MKLKLAIFWRSCTPKHTQKIVHEIQAVSHLLTNAWIDKDLQIITSECFENHIILEIHFKNILMQNLILW